MTADSAPRASDPIISQYSELARAALAGETIADYEHIHRDGQMSVTRS